MMCTHFQDCRARYFSVDNRDIDTSLLKNISLLKNTRDPTSTIIRTFPGVYEEFLAVNLFKTGDNLGLLGFDELLHFETHRGIMGDTRCVFGLGIEFINGGAVGGGGLALVGLVRDQRSEEGSTEV